MALLIKPGDLVDDVINLNIGTGTPKQQNENIVTKGVMPTQSPHLLCLRCGGGSTVTVPNTVLAESTSDQWKVWEKMWTMRCVCGGSWISAI